MSVTLRYEGLAELQAALRRLPAELATEGGGLVEAAGNGAEATIKAGYPTRTGELRNKLRSTFTRDRFGARFVLKNTSKYSDEFDYGSQARHTALGRSTGAMPANPIFKQTLARKRRQMYDQFKSLIERHGLKVTGEAR